MILALKLVLHWRLIFDISINISPFYIVLEPVDPPRPQFDGERRHQ